MNRRNFLKDTSAMVCLGILSQALMDCTKESFTPLASGFSIDLTDPNYSELKSVGGVVLVNGIYIVRTGQSTYAALSNVCTHAGCHVGFNSSTKNFVCPCHGGVYGTDGHVISGPPPAPLAKYKTVLKGTTLSVN